MNKTTEMPLSEIIEVLERETECINRSKRCDRRCGACDLAMPDEKILSAYASAVALLSSSAMKL